MIANKQRLRGLWFTVHKWLGLALGLPVLLIFLSGAVLVWKGSVDDLLHPQRRVAAAASEAPSFYVAAANRIVAPAERIASFTYPSGEGPVVVSTVREGASPMQGRVRYFLHPVTGALLDRASLDARPIRFVHVLHGSLLLGRPGGRFVGLVALILLLSAFSGLWLWWPTKGALLPRPSMAADPKHQHQPASPGRLLGRCSACGPVLDRGYDQLSRQVRYLGRRWGGDPCRTGPR